MNNDELGLFINPELGAELLFAALDLEDLIKGIPSRLIKKQLKTYTEDIDAKIATIFRSNKATGGLHKNRIVNEKKHYAVETMVKEINERIEHDLSDIMVKAHDSLHWVPDNIFMTFTIVVTKSMQYLMEVLPSKPSRALFGMIDKTFKYADFEMSKFNRVFTVIEDPKTVLDDLKNNRVNRESIEVMEVIYPEILANMRSSLTEYFIEKKQKDNSYDISYQQKINLAKFFNTSVSEFLNPDYVHKLQTILKLSDQEAKQGETSTAKASQSQVPSSGVKQRLSQV